MRTTFAKGSVALMLAGAAIPSAAPARQAGAVTRPAGDAVIVTDGVTDAAEPRDRYERLNRGVWGFNQFIDRILLKPVSSGYRAIIPRVARRGITNVFSNLGEPWSFINNLLQAKPGRALNNLGRFVVNTTIGVAGLADHATKLGIAPRPEDFGQTLAAWGVRSSAYVVLPVLGPSTVRDGIGTGVAFVADPYQIAINESKLSVWTKRGIAGLIVVNTRANLTESGADSFLQSSLDPYAAARSAFQQRRAAAIANLDTVAVQSGVTNSSAADPIPGIAAPGAAPVANPDGSVAPDPFLADDPAAAAPAPDAAVAPDPFMADDPVTQPPASPVSPATPRR